MQKFIYNGIENWTTHTHTIHWIMSMTVVLLFRCGITLCEVNTTQTPYTLHVQTRIQCEHFLVCKWKWMVKMRDFSLNKLKNMLMFSSVQYSNSYFWISGNSLQWESLIESFFVIYHRSIRRTINGCYFVNIDKMSKWHIEFWISCIYLSRWKRPGAPAHNS